MDTHKILLTVLIVALTLGGMNLVLSKGNAQESAPATTAAAEPKAPAVKTGTTKHTFAANATDKLTGQYLLFLPEHYGQDPNAKYPVILFLHGSGERGTDLNKVKLHGPPKVAETMKGFPFIVLSPQCPAGKWWDDLDVARGVLAMLDEVIETYHGDPDRVYLTGLSMGGHGSWFFGTQAPERWAAVVPICGWGNAYKASRMKKIPTRVYHGQKDPSVPFARGIDMARALKLSGGNVEMIAYPDGKHDVWTRTYADPKLYEWLLKQKRE